MRFLILTQYYAPETGATQIRLAAMTRVLRRLGHEVEVVTSVPNYPVGRIIDGYRGTFYRREERDGIAIHRTWAYPAMGAGLKRLINYLSFSVTSVLGLWRARRPDYLFVESPPLFLSLPGMLYGALRRVPVIFNVADLWPDAVRDMGVVRPGLALRLAEAFERWTYRRAAVVNAVTEANRVTFAEEKGVPPRKILMLPNGVDTELFHPGPPEPDLVRELGWEGKRVVLFAGGLGIAQGLSVALDAMEQLRDRAPNVLLAFIGRGSERATLEASAKARGLTNVRFYDARPVEDIARLYRCASVGFASLKNLPIFDGTRASKILPAMASGKPVIYSAPGEGARLVERTGAGLAVPPENPTALADAILRLTSDAVLAERMGANGRRFVAAEQDWTVLVERWINELTGVAAVRAA